ncbi:pentraxin-related protein PTX3 [Denticeps clupeoides]|uniref:Pentraxin (PTX) domain-containing protein n=1 Tax=Denticeps clupeoides TaxID=299321 RepID=A0AAY4DEF5_9TELE|nr:pentraxin-related protein PTX3 [Denticeps clupeoides]
MRFLQMLVQVLCALTSTSGVVKLAYEDDAEDIDLNYGPSYFNEISEGEPQEVEPTPGPEPPCASTELSKWDKLFTMLENSQMKENMLLQYADEIVKVELQEVRTELLHFMAQYGSTCTGAVDGAGRRLATQVNLLLQQTVDQLRANRLPTGHLQEALVQQLLHASDNQTNRLATLERACLAGKGSDAKSFLSRTLMAADEGSSRLEKTLEKTLVELQAVRAQMDKNQRQNSLPSGCDGVLIFPMRSPRTYAEVKRQKRTLRAFTVCLWVRPTQLLNETVLLSYESFQNPYELQLLSSTDGSALFTVGGEAHLVEVPGAVGEGRWTHLCGTWSSEQGLASLWADGQKVASSPGVAEGHEMPAGGSMQLGQEASVNGLSFTVSSNLERAFTGKMTGVNMWDRILSPEEISQQAKWEGNGCGRYGNIVGWGITPIVLHGEAKLIF